MNDFIEIKGARENNLRNVTLRIPKHKLVVLTGPSGSGKSTLAMDTLQRECQRQYMESMGMTSEALPKPKVDAIVGLSPSISVGQHVTNRNPRSTVGTVTDIHTYLRVIYEKLGERACPHCGHRFVPGVEDGANASESKDEEDSSIQAVRCPECRSEMERWTRRHFSYNTPDGACDTCGGLGHTVSLDEEAVFNEEQSLRGGCVTIWYDMISNYQAAVLQAAGKHYGFVFDPELPLREYTEVQRDLLLYGVESDAFIRHFPEVKPPKSVTGGKFEGVVTGIWRRYKEKGGESGEAALFREHTCAECKGARLREEIRQVTVGGASITQLSGMSLQDAHAWLERLMGQLQPEEKEQVETLLYDLTVRMKRIVDVGLSYLSLNRQSVTLSGGEAQRLRLASILGSGLTGVLYILDEPTAGLHPRDTAGLIQVLMQLRDMGNSVRCVGGLCMTIYPMNKHLSDYDFFSREFPFYISLNEIKHKFPAHRHDFLECSLVTEGTGYETINGHRHPISRGTFTWLLPYQVHEIVTTSPGPLRLYNCMFEMELLANPTKKGFRHLQFLHMADQPPYTQLQGESLSHIMSLFSSMLKEYENKRLFREESLIMKLHELLIHYQRELPQHEHLASSDHARSGASSTGSKGAAWPIIEFIHSHYREPIALAHLSTEFGMHPARLSSEIKKHTGTTFLQLLHEIRIRHACSLLSATDMSMLEIALEVGFGSYKAFTRVFRDLKRITPGEYRKQCVTVNR